MAMNNTVNYLDFIEAKASCWHRRMSRAIGVPATSLSRLASYDGDLCRMLNLIADKE